MVLIPKCPPPRLGLHRIVNLPDIRPPDIRCFFYRIPDIRPDIRPRYPATGYPVMAGYPAKSALKIKFLPEFRAFNYQIQYKVVSAGISTFYSILTVVNLIWKKYVLFDQQSFSVEFHKVSVLVYENEPVSESTQNGLNREILKKIYLPPPTKIQ